jgi:hypothetical protein
MVDVSRQQVIAYRVAEQGLHRTATSAANLAVLDIGVQDSAGAAAVLALDARLKSTPAARIGPGHRLAVGWTLRGAPHLHRRGDLNALAGALWPLSDADASARLGETGRSIAKMGMSGREAFRLAVDAVHQVVTEPMGKGAVSTAVTRKLPPAMGRDCRGCKTVHVSDPMLRLAALPAGVEFEPDTAPPVLLPRPGAVRPDGIDVLSLQKLITAYLTLLGPATSTDVAGYLDARRADVAAVWPDGLAEVSVEGRAAWLPAARVTALVEARGLEIVRLLNPFDPYLQARDRDVIVPDPAAQKALWPVLGRPGVLFVDGEVAGLWRPRSSGKKLTLNVGAFAPLPPSAWQAIEAEAARIAAVRGASDVRVSRVE